MPSSLPPTLLCFSATPRPCSPGPATAGTVRKTHREAARDPSSESCSRRCHQFREIVCSLCPQPSSPQTSAWACVRLFFLLYILARSGKAASTVYTSSSRRVTSMDVSTSKSFQAAIMHRIVMALSESLLPTFSRTSYKLPRLTWPPSSISGNKNELKSLVRNHSMRVASLTLCNVSTVHVDLSCGDSENVMCAMP